MTRLGDISALVGIVDAQFAAEQAKMSELLRRESDLRAALTRLTHDRGEQAARIRETEEPAWVANADVRWHRWIDQRRTVINAELVQLMSLQMQQRQVMAKSFGKQQAMDALEKRAKLAARKAKQRKADYES